MIAQDGNRLQVTGGITLDNVQYVLQKGIGLLSAPETVVDLAGVTDTDSSAVSLLLAWMRAAASRGIRLQVVHLPASLASLAALYGVQEMIAPQQGSA